MDRHELVAAANIEPKVYQIGRRTGRQFTTTEFTFGVLVPDASHPLSCVSVANSALSIDLWVGCSWQCAYCHVQGSGQDLADNGAMPRKTQRRTQHTVDEIINALLVHPFFVPDVTMISIGTASTEPFAPGVIDSTFEIMDAFIRRGLKNPFWIVTKYGVPRGRKRDFERIVQATHGLMISLCWADNPVEIEPVKNNRFANAAEAKEAGAVLAWYMRPLSPEWSGTREGIEKMMLHVKESSYASLISAIVPGGLRWSEGIENAVTEVRGLSGPGIEVLDDNAKGDLSRELAQDILSLAEEHFPGMPVYFKSSCALTHMLEVASISSVQVFSERECAASICPTAQRERCALGRIHGMSLDEAQAVLDRFSVPARACGWDESGMLLTEPGLDTFTYALRQVVINNLGRGA